MSVFLFLLRLRRLRAAMATIAGLMAGSSIGLRAAHPGVIKQGPCDIFAAGNTPCVAAHSTVRSLYARHTGTLYQVKRASDNATQNIGLLSDGYANAAGKMHSVQTPPASSPKFTISRPSTTISPSPPADVIKDPAPTVPTSPPRRTPCRSQQAVTRSMASRFRQEWVTATTGHRALRSREDQKECTWFLLEPISIRGAVSTMATQRGAPQTLAPATWIRST